MAQKQVVPARSLEQRMDALGRANRVRVFRAQLKRDVKAGRVSARALLTSPPTELETMAVFDLLLAVPKVGKVKANAMLRKVRVAASKTIGGLSERQRDELTLLLP